MKKGLFWYLPGQNGIWRLLTVRDDADAEITRNHRREWALFTKKVTNKMRFDDFPRGRVELRNGRATVFLHPVLCTPSVQREIIAAFDLTGAAVRFVADESAHYQCNHWEE